MVTNILQADAIYGVPTPAALAAKFEAHWAKLRKRGIQVAPTVSATPMVAYIDHGRWLIQCVCGGGVGVHQDWPEARCGCGAIYTAIVFPDNRAAIEAALVVRPIMESRNWVAPESVDTLLAENVAHGVTRAEETP